MSYQMVKACDYVIHKYLYVLCLVAHNIPALPLLQFTPPGKITCKEFETESGEGSIQKVPRHHAGDASQQNQSKYNNVQNICCTKTNTCHPKINK